MLTRTLFLILSCLSVADLVAQPCRPVVNLGDTVTFCQGNTLILNATDPAATSYVWSTGATSSSIQVSSSGLYWVQAANSCGATRDSVRVLVHQPLSIQLGPDQPICNNGSITIDPGLPAYYDYNWSNGSSQSKLTVNQAGLYWLEIKNACGTFRDTIRILPSPGSRNFSLGPDIFKCSPGQVTLSVPPGFTGQFSWSTGASSRSIQVSQTGTYSVTVQNPCGQFTDSIYVQLVDDLQTGLPDTLRKCSGNSVTMGTTLRGNINWSNGTQGNYNTVQQPGSYIMTLQHPCGTLRDTVEVVNYPPYNLELGPDTTACEQLTLSAPPGAISYNWSNGQTGSRFTALGTNTYWVEVVTPCAVHRDTVHVTIKNGPRDVLPDTVGVCPADSAGPLLDAGNWGPATGHLWDDGDTARTHTFRTPGLHWVDVWNECDTLRDTIIVIPDSSLSHLQWPQVIYFCDTGDAYSFLIDSLGPTVGIEWADNWPADSVRKFQNSDTLAFTVFNACDTIHDTLRLDLATDPTTLDFRKLPLPYVALCRGDTHRVELPRNEQLQAVWEDGDSSYIREFVALQTDTLGYTLFNRCDTTHKTIVMAVANPLPSPKVPDTLVCAPLTLDLTFPPNPGQTIKINGQNYGDTAQLDQSGRYILEGTNPCGSFVDTFNLTVRKQLRRKAFPAYFCSGDSALLNASQTQARQYRWSTGDTTPTIFVKQPGWYYVDLRNECDTLRDSVYATEVQPLPPIDLGRDTIFCAGTLTLDAGDFDGASYRWQNGAGSRFFTVNHSGKYWVRVNNGCSVRSDTIEVLITGPPKAVLGTEVHYCSSNSFTLNAQNPGSTYRWNTGDTTQTIPIQQPGTYWVEITNDCGQLVDTVEMVNEDPIPSDVLGPDTLICDGTSLWLNPHLAYAEKNWSTGSAADSIPVTSTGTYWLRAENLCGTVVDSIRVYVETVPRFDKPDTGICHVGDSLLLRGPPGMQRYQWSNGKTSPNIWVHQPQHLSLTVENACFAYTDSLEVQAQYPLDLGLADDTALCQGQVLKVDLRGPDLPVYWSDGNRDALRRIRQSGTYIAAIDNRCGHYLDTLRAHFLPPLVDSSFTVQLCRGDSLKLGPTDYGYQLLWPDSSLSGPRWVYGPGRYTTQIKNPCGQAQWDFQVQEQLCACPLYWPTAFTPTHDGTNETFHPVTACRLSSFEMIIFDRWGKELYRTQDLDQGWNGKVNGQRAPLGTYMYWARYRWVGRGTGQERRERGYFTLVR
ncbi:MAG: gliding motility-associated C-terminal domain-containing protein [Schleiferiaceae bacterium]|nr:gliding motility-associated C-terminal domain-containing protein [Schleiferiaceae bacterium]